MEQGRRLEIEILGFFLTAQETLLVRCIRKCSVNFLTNFILTLAIFLALRETSVPTSVVPIVGCPAAQQQH